MKLQEGTAYLNFNGAKSDEFTLNFGREKMVLTRSVHLRVAMGDTDATLAVFKGDVEVTGPSGSVQMGKKQTATFDLADQDRYTLAKNLEKDPYDDWDKHQEEYHQRYLTSSYRNYSPYAYGMSDLNYYGNYFNAPGYGTLWQPYFTGAGWGSSLGWNTVPRVINPPRQFTPPQPPATSAHNPIVVQRGPSVTPPGSGNKVVIRGDSAGLGIARGSIRDLGKVSQQVRQEGSVTTKVHSEPIRTSPVMSASPAQRGASASGSSASRTTSPGSRVSSPRMSSPAPRSAPPSRSAPSPHTSPPHK